MHEACPKKINLCRVPDCLGHLWESKANVISCLILPTYIRSQRNVLKTRILQHFHCNNIFLLHFWLIYRGLYQGNKTWDMCYDSSCKRTWAGAVLAPVLTGVRGSSLQRWSEMLIGFQTIREFNDLIDSQMIRAPSCLAIQLIRTGFNYLFCLQQGIDTTFDCSINALYIKLYWLKLLHFGQYCLGPCTALCNQCRVKMYRMGMAAFHSCVAHT